MTMYEEMIERQISMCKGNVKSIKEKISEMSNEYLNDVVLLTEACGGFGETEFEIIGFEYIKGYPTLITNKNKDGLTGKGMNVDEFKTILSFLFDNDTLCISIGFENNEKDDIRGILNCISHNSFDLKSQKTKEIYGDYAFQLLI